MFNKANLLVSRMAEKAKNLGKVKFTKRYTVATGGSALLMVTVRKDLRIEDAPFTGEQATLDFASFVLPCEDVEAMLKNLPKAKNRSFKFVENMYVRPKDGLGQVRVFTTDTTMEHSLVISGEEDVASFPRLTKHGPFPKGKPKLYVTFNANLLIKFLQTIVAMSGMRVPEVEFAFYGQKDAARTLSVNETGQTIIGLIMPMTSSRRKEVVDEEEMEALHEVAATPGPVVG